MISAIYLEKWKARESGYTKRLCRIILRESGGGFTLVELLIVVAILGTLFSIGIPVYKNQIRKARIVRAIAEISTLQKEIELYEIGTNDWPLTLNDIGRANLQEPWGNLYEYLNYDVKGKKRKDRFLKPLNSYYDLYSMGKDGVSKENVNHKDSLDDIIRANDGAFIGLASEY